MKLTKTSSQTSLFRKANYWVRTTFTAACVAALVGLASVLSVQAYVLDNFNAGTRTGWTDTPGLCGTFSQSGGQFQIANTCPNALAYSTKTSQSFANASNQTLEFRVDVITVVPGAGNAVPVAILAWLPSGAVPGSGTTGYSLQATAAGATLLHGATVLGTTTYATTDATNNQNTTLVLRMTAPGGGGAGTIDVNARIYRQTGSLPMQTNLLVRVWETTQTVTDSTGTAGYAALGVKSGASGADSVNFDNLQDFVLSDTVLDDFSVNDLAANYSVTAGGPIGIAAVSGGQLELATYTANTTLYVAARRTTPNFVITDGSRLEMAVDVVNNKRGPVDTSAFASLSFTPSTDDSGIGYLLGYHDGAGAYGLSMGKAYGEWWANQRAYTYTLGTGAPVPPSNPGKQMRLIVNMTGEGTSCRIENRIEDLNVGVNDPGRILYQAVFVDTSAADPLDTGNSPRYPDGAIGPASAFMNIPGSIALYAFYGGSGSAPYGSDIVFDNLTVNQTTPPNLPPAISAVFPPDRSNFVNVASSAVTFHVTDDTSIPVNNVGLTLNGVTYANGSGATVAGTTKSVTFTLNGPLLADTFYSGSIQATDNVGAVIIFPYSFDTFRTNAGTCYTIESEDYNFYDTYVTLMPGAFIDNPLLYPNGYGPFADGYVGQVGYAEVDFHDARTSSDSASTYRPSDRPRTADAGDGPRSQYALASATWGTPVPEVALVDRQNGDWNNYTHNYPAGWYHAYLRLSQFALENSVIGLQRVTNPTQTNGIGQTAVDLGVFLGHVTGYDIYDTVPLTDGVGNSLLVHFTGGVDTLRVTNTMVQGPNSGVGQNYLVFAPAAAPGPQPPYVSQVTPANGQVLGVGAPNTGATIVNRDTTVTIGTILVQVNGVTVPSSATATASGATVTWTPVSSVPTLATSLIFQDSASVWHTNNWTYSYGITLQAASSLPVGSLTQTGFDARLVKSYDVAAGYPTYANIGVSGALNNSVASAQSLLAVPCPFSVNVTATNMVQTVNWGIGGNEYPSQANFPGLCLPPPDVNSWAVEIFAYLQLAAGINRIYVDSDDCVGLYSGSNLRDTSNPFVQTTGVVHESIDYLVPAAGLYPFHVIFEEGGGAAYLRLQSVSLSDNSTKLLGDPTGVPAFYPLVVKSSSSPNGPWTADAAANAGNLLAPTVNNTPCYTGGALNNISLTGGTVTVPLPSSPKYYLLDGPRAAKITSVKKVGANLVITYSYQ